MPARVLLHIGVSRTATTTLQQNVFERLPGIVYIGKPYPHQRNRVIEGFSGEDSALLERVVSDIVQGSPAAEAGIPAIRATIDRLTQSTALIVYSNELLSNNQFVPFDALARQLAAAFGPADLMLSIRSQLTVLPSLYLHEMRRRTSDIAFDAWLDEALNNPTRKNHPEESIEQYRYRAMIREFRTAFGGRVGVVMYENLATDLPRYARQLAELTGADSETIATLLSAPAKNRTKSAAWYRYRRLYAKLRQVFPFRLIDGTRAMRDIKLRVKTAIDAKAVAMPGPQVNLSERDRQRINDYFGADNRALAVEMGIELQKHSYPGTV
jgi:hypothetical protein